MAPKNNPKHAGPLLRHLTLNTGNIVAQPRPAAVDLRKLRILATNGGDMGVIHGDLAGWLVDTELGDGAAAFSIGWGGAPAVECVVCWDEGESEKAWKSLESMYLDLSDKAPDMMAANAAPECPSPVPWLGVVILPSWFATPFLCAAHWMGDAERCLAWAIMDAVKTPDRI